MGGWGGKEGGKGEGGEKEGGRREGGRDCALSCRESHGVPDWRKMSKDCSLAEMATDKNAQRLSCLEKGCTTREPEEEEEGVTEGKREGVSRY